MRMLLRAPWLRHRASLIGLALWDATTVYISYKIIYVTRLGKWDGTTLGQAVAMVTWLGFSYLAGRYSPNTAERESDWSSRIKKTAVASAGVISVFVAHSWIYQIVDAQTRFTGFLIPLMLLVCVLSAAGQIVQVSLNKKRRQWLLIGSQKEKQTLESELRANKALNGRVVIANSAAWTSDILKGTSNKEIGIAVGEVSLNDNEVIDRLLRQREKGRCVIPLLSWCEQELQRIPPELVNSEWLINAEGFGLRPGSVSWRIKRFGDVMGALGLIILTAPLVCLGGLLIWVEDQGPVFYSQIRTGLYGKSFRIWKLRSMKTDAEKMGAQWAKRHDPRITSTGRVLRALRIDELPQLVNVLKGDLSLIGPRPERPEIEAELEEKIPNYRIRHWIRPGLSGWAQVCYPYGASAADSRMKLSYDLYYLRNAGIGLDSLIFIKTIRLIAGARGASPSES